MNTLTELEIVEGLKANKLEPLQEFNGSFYCALRITGSGEIDRQGDITYRPIDMVPIEAYAGLPVILAIQNDGQTVHPDSLDSSNFLDVTVGTIMSPYVIKGEKVEEIWGIARLFNKLAVLCLERGYSTSPMVTSKRDENSVETDVLTINHLAIVDLGAWDKVCGSPGSKLNSISQNTTIEDNPMEKEKLTESNNEGLLVDKEPDLDKLENELEKVEVEEKTADIVSLPNIDKLLEELLQKKLNEHFKAEANKNVEAEVEEFEDLESEEKYDEIMDSAKTIKQFSDKAFPLPLIKKSESVNKFADRLVRQVIKFSSPEDSLLLSIPEGKIPFENAKLKLKEIKDRVLSSKKTPAKNYSNERFVFADREPMGHAMVKEVVNQREVINADYTRSKEAMRKLQDITYSNILSKGVR